MRLNFKKIVFVAFAVVFAVSILFLSNNFLNTKAEMPTLWISIDSGELNKVLSETDDLQLNVVAIEKGIAVLRADDWQMQKLSSQMHEHFHKCSGFVAHESMEEAIDSINQTLAADLNQTFVDYTIDNATNVTPLLAEAQETPIKQTITELSAFPNRRYNQPSGLNSANFIKNTWTTLAQGRSDITVEFFNHPTNTSPQPSIILTIQGTEIPNEEIVLGAHQDSIVSGSQTANAPGADDDASGIASLTETIRVIVAKNFRPKRTVKFMAYAAEEVGLRGSAAIALDYRTRNVNVVGVMQLDMTNFKGTAALDIVLITDRTNAAQNQFITNLITAYQPALSVGTSVCGYGCSDHASWTTRNYPASFPFEATFNNSNSAIHTVNDTLARSNNNADHALKFTKLALSYVGELAKGEIIQNTVPGRARADFDGDGKTDVSVFRPDTGVWYLNRSTDGFLALNWGISTDKVVPADFNGDGQTDIAIFRANSDSNLPDFYILQTSDYTFSGFSWGIEGDLPLIADYDGDETSDIAIFRPSSNTWYILQSSDGAVLTKTFGQINDKPIIGDFDGDGKADLTLLRNANQWIVHKSSNGYETPETFDFGLTGDIPVPADFDGDGTDNIAVFRPSNGTWYYLRTDNAIAVSQFGATGDVPATGDYDGDGTSDFAVYRPTTGVWYILRSSNGSYQIENFGLSQDLPLPSAFQN